MRRVADIAAGLGTTIVRVFSFFMPAGEPAERYRSQVIDRMGALARIAEERGLVLAHENEKEIYGDVPDRCADLITAVGSPALRATFDPANFVQCGVRPYSGAYAVLRPYLVYLQVKDARAATGEVVPAGAGRRGTARDAGRAAGGRLRGLHVARAAPGAVRALRRLQRPGGLSPGRVGFEISTERSVDLLAVTSGVLLEVLRAWRGSGAAGQTPATADGPVGQAEQHVDDDAQDQDHDDDRGGACMSA